MHDRSLKITLPMPKNMAHQQKFSTVDVAKLIRSEILISCIEHLRHKKCNDEVNCTDNLFTIFSIIMQ